MSILGRAELQAPLAVVRNRLSSLWRVLFRAAGRYRPIPAEDREIALSGVISFHGDIPVQIGGAVREQGRWAFRIPRPDEELVTDLVVTPMGGAWKDGCFHERYSACRPGLRMLAENHEPQADYPAGYFIQSAHKDTYGDWVMDYLTALARIDRIEAPLFLPAGFSQKPYVRRDLERAGVRAAFIDRPVRIEQATVLRQKKYYVHIAADEVAKLERFLGVAPAPPDAGSILYLCRRGEVSEIADRTYPHAALEAVVSARGGRVMETASATLEDYIAVASSVETVIFDHGSAFLNAVHWRPKKVIEIVSDAWWNNAFLMFADASGVKDYTIIRGDLGDAHVARRLNEALDRPPRT